MNLFQRVVLLLKVLVLLSLGLSAAWASDQAVRVPGFWGPGHLQNGLQMIARSESEPGDQGQGGSADDDDATTDEPDTDSEDETSQG
ncbi:hypothetical protein [Pseudomonas chlororaphis]|uniref:hypothetical protein n=1 Tax=Pseudomonas chlororaphis TaxID=587753 RepID=UPI0003D2F77F|nr:hypothetical protein [Pseudomonas chlororaphis]AZD27639.1 hypothetical protein C4K23_0870 [Pseudomonas chlororaphis]ETD35742.1 hypothetical protein U724_24245 [Pseudomonas chlororaphis subsp. aurantiaca PB-St2]QFS53233.1 hypothetical protein FD951_01285 [Pseudomonas chlororaphis subsp. aurantiaca]